MIINNSLQNSISFKVQNNYENTLNERIKNFQKTCIEPRKNKKHLVFGNYKMTPDSISLMSNDYLSLVKHPKIVQTQIDSLQAQDHCSLMSAVFIRGDDPQTTFQDSMATHMETEAAILCQSGYSANVGLVQSIANKDTPVYIDFFAHASLWDGIVAGGAQPFAFFHNNMAKLEQAVKKNGPGIIIVDAVYSVTGDFAPLEQLVEIAKNYGCICIVDESHSLGLYGKKGAGLVQELGLTNEVDFITASLAKTFAGRGGIIACSREFSNYFPYVSQNAIFSSCLLPSEIAGFQKTLEIIQESDDRRQQLFYNADYLREGIDEIGYNVEASETAIISIETGTEEDTETFRDAIEKRQLFGAVFCAPATPKNRACMRFCVNSSMTMSKMNRVLEILEDVKDEVYMARWSSTRKKKNKPEQKVINA